MSFVHVIAVFLRSLLRTQMVLAAETRLGGAPRIHSELELLGYRVSETTVDKYMIRHRKPPSQTWRNFLDNH